MGYPASHHVLSWENKFLEDTNHKTLKSIIVLDRRIVMVDIIGKYYAPSDIRIPGYNYDRKR